MSLFNSPKTILLLKRDCLQILTSSQQVQQLTFPPEVVKHQEIIDRRGFEKLVTDFFSHLKKQEAIMLLSDDILFRKQLPLTATPEEIQSFFDTVPFSQSIVVKKSIKTTKNIVLFATNRDLFQTVGLLALKHSWEIKEVLPLMIFEPYLQGQELSYQTLTQAMTHTEFRDAANFLKEEKGGKSEENHNNVPLKQYLILAASILFFLGALGIAAMNLGLFPSKSQKNPTALPTTAQPKTPSTIETTSIPSATPSTSTQTQKTDIKIQILNSSGVAGQAAVVKEQLASIGFTNAQIITEGNSNAQMTTVIFSDKMNFSFKNQILTKLQTLFTTVDAQATSSASTYDVFIITKGEIKK